MVTHDVLPGTGISTYPKNLQSGTIPGGIYIYNWDQAFYVNGTSNGSNYWQISLVYSDLSVIASVDTAALTTQTWGIEYNHSVNEACDESDIALRIRVTGKVGSPGDLYWQGAQLLCSFD
jgi:hypothetical protein